MEWTRKPQYEFSKAVRPAFFSSMVEDQQYFSSHGGCITVGHINGRAIGITCRHVLAEYLPTQLLISESLWGETSRGANIFIEIKGDKEDTSGSEIEDIMICAWDGSQPKLIPDEIINFDKIVDSNTSDDLIVIGFLKSEADFYAQPARVSGLELSITDVGQYGEDKFLRAAGGLHDESFGFENLTGFSGGLVYNLTRNGPTGITVRGGVEDGHVKLYFVLLSTILDALKRLLPQFENQLAKNNLNT